MAQPQLARITCPQCNACYNSESDLLTHMGVAHRMGRGTPSFQSREPDPEAESYGCTQPEVNEETGSED